jgi:hypothetical protein
VESVEKTQNGIPPSAAMRLPPWFGHGRVQLLPGYVPGKVLSARRIARSFAGDSQPQPGVLIFASGVCLWVSGCCGLNHSSPGFNVRYFVSTAQSFLSLKQTFPLRMNLARSWIGSEWEQITGPVRS